MEISHALQMAEREALLREKIAAMDALREKIAKREAHYSEQVVALEARRREEDSTVEDLTDDEEGNK